MKNPDTLTGAGDKIKFVDSATSIALKSLRAKYPDPLEDGARCGFLGKYPGDREPGGYPKGFHPGRSTNETLGLPDLIAAIVIAPAPLKNRNRRANA
jgi:hypothetical protein